MNFKTVGYYIHISLCKCQVMEEELYQNNNKDASGYEKNLTEFIEN